MDRSGHDRARPGATPGFRHGLLSVVAILALSCAACGGGSPSGPEQGGGPAAVFTITSSGVSPKSVTVTLGAQVSFINNDVDTHLMFSDPHPEHTDCPEINQVGSLARGQTRQTGNLNTPRTCGFHDHDQPFNAGLRGTIVIR